MEPGRRVHLLGAWTVVDKVPRVGYMIRSMKALRRSSPPAPGRFITEACSNMLETIETTDGKKL